MKIVKITSTITGIVVKTAAENWLPISVGVIFATIFQLILWTWHHSRRESRIEVVKILFAHWSLWFSRTFLAMAIVQVANLVKLFLGQKQSSDVSETLQTLQTLLVCSLFSWCLLNLHNFLLRVDANLQKVSNTSEFACLQQQLSKHHENGTK